MYNDKKILVIDYCNYQDYPIGGFLTFAKNLLSVFKNSLTLVGITTNKDEPVGCWFKKTINGEVYDYFALKRYSKAKTKHFIPDRLVCFVLLRYYRKRIMQAGIPNVFVQRHEILPAIRKFRYPNICYRFPGLENPLEISKYWYGKHIAGKFDHSFFNSLKEVQLILAAGDQKAIDEMIIRSNGLIEKKSVIKFPTRIDTNIFKPAGKEESRSLLNIPVGSFIITTSGRLAWFKGWKFMIDCFILFQSDVPGSIFYIIGEGEDLNKIKDYLCQKNIADKVILTGGKKPDDISLYLNASDLFIMGSYKEGWSTALSEAIACGVPCCVTDFSSARDIVLEGRNGYIIEKHDENLFLEGMKKAMKIRRPVYNENVREFSKDRLKEDLLKFWKLI